MAPKKRKEKHQQFLEAFATGFGFVALIGIFMVFPGGGDEDFGLKEVIIASFGMGVLLGLIALLIENSDKKGKRKKNLELKKISRFKLFMGGFVFGFGLSGLIALVTPLLDPSELSLGLEKSLQFTLTTGFAFGCLALLFSFGSFGGSGSSSGEGCGGCGGGGCGGGG